MIKKTYNFVFVSIEYIVKRALKRLSVTLFKSKKSIKNKT